MRISDWSSDVCSSDLLYEFALEGVVLFVVLWFLFYKTDARRKPGMLVGTFLLGYGLARFFVEFFREPDIQLGTLSWGLTMGQTRSEEHTSELQSLMRISYAVFCLQKKKET